MANRPVRKHEHPPKGMITAADLLAGAVMPMKLTLNVTIRPGMGHGAAEDPDCPQRPRPRPPKVEDRLSQYTPQVLEWARRNRDNATMLLVDPKGAAARSGVKLSRADARALDKHVHAAGATEVLPPGVELVALDVRVAGDRQAPGEKAKEGKQARTKETRRKR